MTPAPSDKLIRIARASRVLSRCTTAALVLAGLAFAAGFIAVLLGGPRLSVDRHSFPTTGLTPGQRTTILVLLAISGGVLLEGLRHVRRLLRHYGRGEIFTRASAREVFRIGIACVLWGFIKFGWALMPRFVLAERSTRSVLELDALFVGLVLIAISWFAEAAARLREDNDLTI